MHVVVTLNDLSTLPNREILNTYQMKNVATDRSIAASQTKSWDSKKLCAPVRSPIHRSLPFAINGKEEDYCQCPWLFEWRKRKLNHLIVSASGIACAAPSSTNKGFVNRMLILSGEFIILHSCHLYSTTMNYIFGQSQKKHQTHHDVLNLCFWPIYDINPENLHVFFEPFWGPRILPKGIFKSLPFGCDQPVGVAQETHNGETNGTSHRNLLELLRIGFGASLDQTSRIHTKLNGTLHAVANLTHEKRPWNESWNSMFTTKDK